MNKVFQKTFPVFLLCASFLLALPARAQIDDFSVIFSPMSPAVGQQTQARLESYRFDVGRANIFWRIDEKKEASGVGNRIISFKWPELGKSKTISASVILPDGREFSDDIFLTGNDMDLLWEAETFVPAGYKGKKLPVFGSRIKVSAIPYLFVGGQRLAAGSLVYEWSLDFKKDLASSGGGKNSFAFRLTDYNDHYVTARISNPADNISFEKTLIFNADNFKPQIILYADDPLEGPRYNSALSKNAFLRDKEIVLRAEPFFFSSEIIDKLIYEWKMNDARIYPEEFPNAVVLRAYEESGAASVDVMARNPIEYIQSAREKLLIDF